MNNLLNTDRANKIYDILVELGGANEDDRQDFIYYHCEDKHGCIEWRFSGKLGFGGKYRSSWNGVTYYRETETQEMKYLANIINIKLKEI